jgi:Major Facilitator Superfamily
VRSASNSVDSAWASTEWTLARALRTSRFWWIVLAYFCALFAWYAIQVHQTKYLIEVGFSPLLAAWALGIVSAIAIPGQIGLGALSDRVGREWVWSIGCLGFAICYGALIALEHVPSVALLHFMVASQGFLGYALTSVMGPIVAEIFEGPHYGHIFGTITVALIGGGAAGPWVAGVIHDATGSYRLAFLLAIACCAVSAVRWRTSAVDPARSTVPLVIGRLAAGIAKGLLAFVHQSLTPSDHGVTFLQFRVRGLDLGLCFLLCVFSLRDQVVPLLPLLTDLFDRHDLGFRGVGRRRRVCASGGKQCCSGQYRKG